jgi:putative FmdB family regulatory protein
MPLYEYQCSKCGNVFEVMQKFSDAPLTVHEGCGGAVERLLSAPALQFKGSGWYITDYARSQGSAKSETKAAAQSDSAAAGTGSKPDSGAASKSETKTAPAGPAAKSD